MGDQEGCVFCRIVNKQASAYVIDENDEVIVFLSLENHPLVVPKMHIPDIYAMPGHIGACVMAEAIRVARAVKTALQCDGTYLTQSNEPAAGQDVFHFHMHVYPCWEGKERKAIGRFFRSVTDPASITEGLKAATCERIREALADPNE
jgi:histidine triad (HIT) family protein